MYLSQSCPLLHTNALDSQLQVGWPCKMVSQEFFLKNTQNVYIEKHLKALDLRLPKLSGFI
jgi:hypothetical protein